MSCGNLRFCFFETFRFCLSRALYQVGVRVKLTLRPLTVPPRVHRWTRARVTAGNVWKYVIPVVEGNAENPTPIGRGYNRYPMCKCSPLLCNQRPDESIVSKCTRFFHPMSLSSYNVHPHTGVTQVFTPTPRIAAGCTNGNVTTGATTEARASSTFTV